MACVMLDYYLKLKCVFLSDQKKEDRGDFMPREYGASSIVFTKAPLESNHQFFIIKCGEKLEFTHSHDERLKTSP